MDSFPYLEPVCCSMFSSNCCFLTCIQISEELLTSLEVKLYSLYRVPQGPTFYSRHSSLCLLFSEQTRCTPPIGLFEWLFPLSILFTQITLWLFPWLFFYSFPSALFISLPKNCLDISHPYILSFQFPFSELRFLHSVYNFLAHWIICSFNTLLFNISALLVH